MPQGHQRVMGRALQEKAPAQMSPKSCWGKASAQAECREPELAREAPSLAAELPRGSGVELGQVAYNAVESGGE